MSVVSLAPGGAAMVDMLRQVIAETIDEVLDPVSAADRTALIDILSRVAP